MNKCARCGKILKNGRKYCSRKCYRSFPPASINCQACGKTFTVPYAKRDRKFCSRECYSSKPEFNGFYGKNHTNCTKATISIKNTGKKRNPEERVTMSERVKGVKNPFYHKQHSTATKQLMSKKGKEHNKGKNNPFYGKTHSPETRAKMSATRVDLIKKGIINPIRNSKHGIYHSIKYDSCYELKRLQQLELDDTVSYFQKNNNLTIRYKDNLGQDHKYIPDLITHYKNGTITIEEIKGYERAIDKQKYKAATNFCEQMGWIFRVLYKHNLFATEHEYRTFMKGI